MKRLLVIVAVVMALSLSACDYLNLPLATRRASVSQKVTAKASQTAAPASKAATATPNKKPKATAKPAKLTKKQLIAAFNEVAFGSEYSNSSHIIRKWTKKLKVVVHGSATKEDQAALKRAMDWLNAIKGFPGISIVKSGANVNIWFVTEKKMPDVVSGYVKGNWGFFYSRYNSKGMTDASVAIATDVTQQKDRNHLIFEELIQCTGLMQDLYDYPDSIFYGKWTTVRQPSDMDRELMRMLYMPEIKNGMTMAKAVAVLNSKFKPAD